MPTPQPNTTSHDATPPQPPAPTSPTRKRFKLRWLFLGGLTFILLLIAGVYIVAFWHKPDPRTDYLAMLNAKAAAVPEEDRAWPLYRELIIKYNLAKMDRLPGQGPLRNPHYKPAQAEPAAKESAAENTPPPAEAAGDSSGETDADSFEYSDIDTTSEFLTDIGRITPDDARWPQAKAELDKHADLFHAIRHAASKPELGLVLKFAYGPDEAIPNTMFNSTWDPKDPKVLYHLPLPFVYQQRKLGSLLSLDFHYAVHQKDWDRAQANLQAMLKLAHHLNETPVAIHSLIHMRGLHWLYQNISSVLEHQSRELPHDTLLAWQTLLQQAKLNQTADLSGENMIVMDALQHAYGPNGKITYEGILTMNQYGIIPPMLDSMNPRDHPAKYKIALTASLPWIISTTGSHQDMVDELAAISQAINDHLQTDSKTLFTTDSSSITYSHSFQTNSDTVRRYWPLDFRYGNPIYVSVEITRRLRNASNDALLVAIALERCRRDTGSYPDTLDNLVPQYLPEHPKDFLTGQPLLYLLRDGKPILYSRGLDGDDDNATPDTNRLRKANNQDGDYILYPLEQN